MKNFIKLSTPLNVFNAKVELANNEHLWNNDGLRKSFDDSPFKECDDIILRYDAVLPPVEGEYECENRAEIYLLPSVRELVYNLMATVKGERLGRVLVSRMPPGAKIDPHPDAPMYSNYYDRFHIVLNGTTGSTFFCGEESTDMLTGEVWWFQNSLVHSVENNSAEDRVHVVVDIRLPK